MLWPMLALSLAFLGIAVLGVLAVRVFIEAQRLGHQVVLATDQVTRAAEDLERAATPLVDRSRGEEER